MPVVNQSRPNTRDAKANSLLLSVDPVSREIQNRCGGNQHSETLEIDEGEAG